MRERNSSLLAAGLLGALAGAAGAMAAMFLSDPNNRKRVQQQFNDLRNEGMKTMDEVSSRARSLTNRLQRDAQDKGEQYASEIRKSKVGRKLTTRRRGRPKTRK